MERVNRETLVSILENAAKNTTELNHCTGAVLIGSQAAYQISTDQRKPKDGADWDFIISPSYLLSWLKGARVIDIQMINPPNQNENVSPPQHNTPVKKSILSNLVSKISFKQTAEQPN
mmetsp:Transcript_4796/g.6698  ORF Transcript_4796/g.6698 Transcript_4796/m.6698 type:complete len:118 (-) Transcript_4796:1494-1847(-)